MACDSLMLREVNSRIAVQISIAHFLHSVNQEKRIVAMYLPVLPGFACWAGTVLEPL